MVQGSPDKAAQDCRTAFFAFPSEPRNLRQTVEDAVSKSPANATLEITPWPKLNVVGLKLDDLIRDRINQADVLIADVTFPNFNVYYEIGYALALRKAVVPTSNSSFKDSKANASLIGVFDTIGQVRYENSDQLSAQLYSCKFLPWVNKYVLPQDHNQPLFLLDTYRKTDFRNWLVQNIGNSQVQHLVLQAVDRTAACDEVWLAVGAAARGRLSDPRVRKLCLLLGFGLLGVSANGAVEVLIEPKPWRPWRDNKRRARLVNEHKRRIGDPALGGMTKLPIMTAYRQQALACAASLVGGPRRTADLRPIVPNAASILLRNVYGWFTRIERGVYELTSEGGAALARWPVPGSDDRTST